MTEEPTDADGAPTATRRDSKRKKYASPRPFACRQNGSRLALAAWRCVIACWRLQAPAGRPVVTQLSAARAAAGRWVGPAARAWCRGREIDQPPARPQTRLKCRHFSARQTSDPDHRRHGTLQPGGATVPATAAAQAPELPVTRDDGPAARDFLSTRVAVGSVRLILFSYSCARAHARDETWARRLSYLSIRQRRLSSACTQCLRPLLVLLSAAATHSSNVHPTWENRYIAAMISCRTGRGPQL